MTAARTLRWVIGAAIAAVLAACATGDSGTGVSVGESDLGGVVSSAHAPEAGQAAQSHRRRGARRARRRTVLPRDLLVLDAADTAAERVRRAYAHPQGGQPGRVAEADEEHGPHRLPSARPGVDAH